MNILSVVELSKKYRKKNVLKSVNFNIQEGSIVGFVGNNGVGKTTTIKCIMNETKFTGSILFKDEKIKNFNQLKEIALFPDLNNLPLDIRAIDYIGYIAKINFISGEEFDERVAAILKFVDIKEILTKTIKKLSSGQKKLVIMAGVLIKSPSLIIMDEPSSNLDVENKISLFKTIVGLNKMGITFLITSHILDELQEIIDHLIILENQQLVYNKKFDKKTESIKDLYDENVKRKTFSSDDFFSGIGAIYGKNKK